ncbi:MAG: hypothetical protein JJ891_16770 [Rhizobiaceae bacterium]|nr:hypothetical protein [Rhizobiaceae bacterium]
MANKKKQTVSYRRLQLPRLLPDGLLGVARDRGEVERSLAARFDALSGQASGMADNAARNEGTRQGRIEGASEGFRPTRSNSIRGQAYDAAGERAYMQKLESDLRTDMQQLYEQHRTDPVQLNQSFSALKTEYEGKHVYAEIAGDFEQGFVRLSTAYRKSAADAHQRKRDQEEQAAMLARLNNLDTVTSQTLLTVDPESPAGEALVSDTLGQYEKELDRAVAAGRMTPVQAETKRQMKRREVATGFYTRQAELLGTVQEVEDYRASLRSDFTEGKLDHVDAASYEMIDSKLAARSRQIATKGRQATSATVKETDDIAGRIASGFRPKGSEISELLDTARRSPDSDRLLAGVRSKLGLAEKFSSSTLGENSETARQLLERARETGDPDDLDLARWAEKTVEAIRKEVVESPIAAAAARGVIEQPTSLSITAETSLEDYAQFWKKRTVSAETAADYWGVEPRMFLPGEVSFINSRIENDPALGIDVAAGLLAGSGEYREKALSELGKSAPKVAEAGKVLLAGGTRQSAIDAIRGSSKLPDGRARLRLARKQETAVAREVYGDAFSVQQGDGDLARRAAANIARARLHDMGIDPKDGDAARPVYEQALQDAAGANVVAGKQYGGIHHIQRNFWFADDVSHKVVVPPTMRTDLFEEVIGSITDDDLAAQAILPTLPDGTFYSAADFHDAKPVAVKGGYAFAAGDPSGDNPQWIRGEDGKPYVLDIEAMRERLGARVPGAWK